MKWIPNDFRWRNLVSSVNEIGRGGYAIIATLFGLVDQYPCGQGVALRRWN